MNNLHHIGNTSERYIRSVIYWEALMCRWSSTATSTIRARCALRSMIKKVIAAGRPAAIPFVGIHMKYTFCVSLPGTKIGIEESKRKKSE